MKPSRPRQRGTLRRLLRSAQARGVPLFLITGLVVGATVAVVTEKPLLPHMIGIGLIGALFGWLRTGWRSTRRRR